MKKTKEQLKTIKILSKEQNFQNILTSTGKVNYIYEKPQRNGVMLIKGLIFKSGKSSINGQKFVKY